MLLVDIAVDRRDVVHRLVESPAVGALVVGAVTDAVSVVASVSTLVPRWWCWRSNRRSRTGRNCLPRCAGRFRAYPWPCARSAGDSATTARATAAGASSYLKKPVGTTQVREAFAQAASLPTHEPRNETNGHGRQITPEASCQEGSENVEAEADGEAGEEGGLRTDSAGVSAAPGRARTGPSQLLSSGNRRVCGAHGCAKHPHSGAHQFGPGVHDR